MTSHWAREGEMQVSNLQHRVDATGGGDLSVSNRRNGAVESSCCCVNTRSPCRRALQAALDTGDAPYIVGCFLATKYRAHNAWCS